MQHRKYLTHALNLASEHAVKGDNGPFGAVIVKNDQVIAEGWNQVVEHNDPTAHAEIVAIRNACKQLGTFKLEDCVLYASCEPCPMCLSAIYWARLDAVYYAAKRDVAAAAGFDDEKFYNEICSEVEDRTIKCEHLPLPEAETPFLKWRSNPNKIDY